MLLEIATVLWSAKITAYVFLGSDRVIQINVYIFYKPVYIFYKLAHSSYQSGHISHELVYISMYPYHKMVYISTFDAQKSIYTFMEVARYDIEK